MKTKVISILSAALVLGVLFCISKLFVIVDLSSCMSEERRAMSGKWESTFSNHVSSADNLDIFDYVNDEVLGSVTNKHSINQLIAEIKVDEQRSDHICFCLGEYCLIFKEGTNEVARIGVHADDYPNARLGWVGGEWPEHAVLTPESSARFYKWIDKHKN